MEKSFKSKKCIVYKCKNESDQGRFVGDLCYPCFEFISSGKGIYSQAYRNALEINKNNVHLTDVEKLVLQCHLFNFKPDGALTDGENIVMFKKLMKKLD